METLLERVTHLILSYLNYFMVSYLAVVYYFLSYGDSKQHATVNSLPNSHCKGSSPNFFTQLLCNGGQAITFYTEFSYKMALSSICGLSLLVCLTLDESRALMTISSCLTCCKGVWCHSRPSLMKSLFTKQF